MAWRIDVFEDDRGNEPVTDFLDSKKLSNDVRKKAVWKIELLKEMGDELERPHCEYLCDGIYELRVKDVRILYFRTGNRFVLLHAFKKKTDAVPQGEIDKAKKRKAIYLERMK